MLEFASKLDVLALRLLRGVAAICVDVQNMEQHIQDKEEEHMESEESDAEEEQRAARLDKRSFEDYNKVMTEQAASASATTEDPNAYDDQSGELSLLLLMIYADLVS